MHLLSNALVHLSRLSDQFNTCYTTSAIPLIQTRKCRKFLDRQDFLIPLVDEERREVGKTPVIKRIIEPPTEKCKNSLNYVPRTADLLTSTVPLTRYNSKAGFLYRGTIAPAVGDNITQLLNQFHSVVQKPTTRFITPTYI